MTPKIRFRCLARTVVRWSAGSFPVVTYLLFLSIGNEIWEGTNARKDSWEGRRWGRELTKTFPPLPARTREATGWVFHSRNMSSFGANFYFSYHLFVNGNTNDQNEPVRTHPWLLSLMVLQGQHSRKELPHCGVDISRLAATICCLSIFLCGLWNCGPRPICVILFSRKSFTKS